MKHLSGSVVKGGRAATFTLDKNGSVPYCDEVERFYSFRLDYCFENLGERNGNG